MWPYRRFLQCPQEDVVNLARVHTDTCMATTCGAYSLQCPPPMTSSREEGMTQSRQCDVNALLAGPNDKSPGISTSRRGIYVRLLDASEPNSKPQEILQRGLTFSIFALLDKKTAKGFESEVSSPVRETVVAGNWERLWFKTILRDHSGSMKEGWMNETAALNFARLAKRGELLEAHTEYYATQLDSAGKIFEFGAGGARRITMTVMAAGDEQHNKILTQATLELIPFLENLKDDTLQLHPAALHMVMYPHAEDVAKIDVPSQTVLNAIESEDMAESRGLLDAFKFTTLFAPEHPLATRSAGMNAGFVLLKRAWKLIYVARMLRRRMRKRSASLTNQFITACPKKRRCVRARLTRPRIDGPNPAPVAE